MRKKITTISGVAIFIMVLTANIQYAIEGYGIGENSLHAEVLAQSTTSGGSGSSNGGGDFFWEEVITNTQCTYEEMTTYWVCGGIPYPYYVAGCKAKTEKKSFKGKITGCIDGNSFCWSGRCVGEGTST